MSIAATDDPVEAEPIANVFTCASSVGGAAWVRCVEGAHDDGGEQLGARGEIEAATGSPTEVALIGALAPASAM